MAIDCKKLGLSKITLDAQQLSVAKNLLKYCDEYKITNKFIRNAILVICWKESGFRAVVEDCYGGTPNSRIRTVFGARVADLNEAQLTALKKDCVKFFDKVYGKVAEKFIGFKTGNDQSGDGFKYRGRGLNGITFKVQYADIGKKLGIDLVKNPELLEKPDLQAKATILYFAEIFKNYDTLLKRKFGSSAKDVKDYETALKMIYNINAGLGYNINYLIANDITGGWAYTQCAKDQIPILVSSSSGGTTKVPLLPILAGLFFFTVINPKWIKKNTPRSLKKFLS
jgi:predicted chitinase